MTKLENIILDWHTEKSQEFADHYEKELKILFYRELEQELGLDQNAIKSLPQKAKKELLAYEELFGLEMYQKVSATYKEWPGIKNTYMLDEIRLILKEFPGIRLKPFSLSLPSEIELYR